jgi:hypothetical protein
LLGHLRTVQLILLVNFVALMLHQFEEYGWPGGFPWIMNEVIRHRGGPTDRYPLNQNNAFFINVVLAWPFYLIPVFFPDVVCSASLPPCSGWVSSSVTALSSIGSSRASIAPGWWASCLGMCRSESDIWSRSTPRA